MNFFIVLCFVLSCRLHATTLEKFRTASGGVTSQRFVFEGGRTSFEKTSNEFDLIQNDYSIGSHRLSSGQVEFSKLMKKVAEYSEKFKAVDEFLQTKDSSFNEVAGAFEHETVILVDQFRVRPQSKYYAELDRVFKKIRALKWTLEKGYRVSGNLEKLMEIDQGKVLKSSPYARDLYCQKVHPPTVCTFHGGGWISVK